MPIVEMWEATSKGVLDIMDSWPGLWAGKTVMALCSNGMPFTMRDHTDHRALLHEYGLLDLARKSYAEQNIYLVRTHPFLRTVLWTKSPVTSAADFEGKKIRTAGPIADVLTLAGASTVARRLTFSARNRLRNRTRSSTNACSLAVALSGDAAHVTTVPFSK